MLSVLPFPYRDIDLYGWFNLWSVCTSMEWVGDKNSPSHHQQELNHHPSCLCSYLLALVWAVQTCPGSWGSGFYLILVLPGVLMATSGRRILQWILRLPAVWKECKDTRISVPGGCFVFSTYQVKIRTVKQQLCRLILNMRIFFQQCISPKQYFSIF